MLESRPRVHFQLGVRLARALASARLSMEWMEEEKKAKIQIEMEEEAIILMFAEQCPICHQQPPKPALQMFLLLQSV